VTRGSLSAEQAMLLEIIENLGWGHVDGLLIESGQPNYERPPRIVQEIKLDAEPERPPDNKAIDFILKKAFVSLFDELSRLRTGVVDIEVRHGAPFRLILERGPSELTGAKRAVEGTQ